MVNDAAAEATFIQRGASKELTPIDLTEEPDLQALVKAVNFEELLEA